MSKFTQKMKDSEYAAGTAALHRLAADMVEKRRLKPMRAKTWYDVRRRGGTAAKQNKDNPFKHMYTKADIRMYNERQQRMKAEREKVREAEGNEGTAADTVNGPKQGTHCRNSSLCPIYARKYPL